MSDLSFMDKLDLSGDEVKRLTNAFKDEKFRKLFGEYAEEISDPENRKKYEEEIAQMEKDRGMDVKFVHPIPGYIIKTSDGSQKIFINIATNDLIGKPSFEAKTTPWDGKRGMQWSIPHSFSPPRDDLDNSGNKTKIYDVIFHPDTYRMAESNGRFKSLMESTAFDGIERQFEVKIDQKNLKYPKSKYKGVPQATVIRTKDDGSSTKVAEVKDDDPLFPNPYGNETTEEKSQRLMDEANKRNEQKTKQAQKTKITNINRNKGSESESVPNYRIVHRSGLDIQEFRNARDSKPSTRPIELVIHIDLPLIDSASSVDLDIFERMLKLESETPAKYKLEINLPYPIDEEKGNAKFDKLKHCLTVTLPVLPQDISFPSFDPIENSSANLNQTSEDTVVENNDHRDLESSPNSAGPLIQVLASECTEPLKVGDDGNTKDIWSSSEFGENPTMHFKPSIVYTVPQYNFEQDKQTVSFYLNVKNVVPDSVSKTFSTDGKIVTFRFISKGSGGFPVHYSFCIKFFDACQIVPEQCNSEVSQDKINILLLKTKDSRYEWKYFAAGENKENLEEHLFLKDEDLSNRLDAIAEATKKRESDQSTTMKNKPDFKVTEMNKDVLTIHVGDVVNDSEEVNIEVMEEKTTTTKLKGIIKQRSFSLSESSDDLSSSYNGTLQRSVSVGGSTMSDSDGNEVRKSVKFSEHIDTTTFKTNSSVTSMKAALKSKRRRVRKRELKLTGRVRGRTSSSDYSSSDDMHGDNPDEYSNPDDSDLIATSDDGSPIENIKFRLCDLEEHDKEIEDGGNEDPFNVETGEEKANENFERTNKNSKKNKKGKNKNKQKKGQANEGDVKTVVKGESGDNKCDDSVSDHMISNVDNDERTIKKNKSPNKMEQVKEAALQSASKVDEPDSDDGDVINDNKEQSSENRDSKIIELDERTAKNVKRNKNKRSKNKKGVNFAENNGVKANENGNDKPKENGTHINDVETVLNWNDQPIPDELKPASKVKLSNSVMYDLDID